VYTHRAGSSEKTIRSLEHREFNRPLRVHRGERATFAVVVSVQEYIAECVSWYLIST